MSSHSTLSLNQLYNTYKAWVYNNPNLVTDVEVAVTWSSYFFAGKVNNSPLVSELVFSLSKLLSLHNDRLIRAAYNTQVPYDGLKEKIKLLLTVIHYSEVLIEMAVRRKWGNNGKWTVATILQLIKCSSALVLVYKFREMPIQHPPIPALQRRSFIEQKTGDENSNGSYVLKRSGRVIRTVEGAPPTTLRDWQPIKQTDLPPLSPNVKSLTYAETIHVLKPLIHLISMKTFSANSWKHWLVALGLDVTSLQLYSKHVNALSREDKIEIGNRRLSLLLYLLRSPMYNKHTKRILEHTLACMSNNIPMMRFLCNPLLHYLSYWQDTYFYMWSS